MSERELPAGTTMVFGVPAHPMPEIMADVIGQVVAQVPGICEAYIPQCYIEGDSEAKQVLVIGVVKMEMVPEVMQDLMSKMQLVLPAGQYMDIIPYESSSIPQGARVESCHIFGKPRKPWWKIW